MAESNQNLKEQLLFLQDENLRLKSICENLQQEQANYELIIGENNTNYLRSDMARMELEQIFSAYTDAMWGIREDGIVVRANHAMLQMLNKSAEDVIGKPCSALFVDDLCDSLLCPLKRIDEQQTQEQDIRLSNGETESRHYLLTSAPLITLDGTPGIVAQFKDITDRKKTEQALAEANQRLEKMARIDGLTQIANRRSFDETIEKEWLRLRRDQKPLSLLLGDIDFFKKFNDHYGHQAGDDCLRLVAKALAASVLRPADLAARYGGEEFAILLPEVDIEGALQVGERILAAIRQLGIEHQQSAVSDSVTISLGTATLIPHPNQAPEVLIAQADEALYQAKEQGRNRVVPAVAKTTAAR